MKYITNKRLSEAVNYAYVHDFESKFQPGLVGLLRPRAKHGVELDAIYSHRRDGTECAPYVTVVIRPQWKDQDHGPLVLDMTPEFFGALPILRSPATRRAHDAADATRSDAVARTVEYVRRQMAGCGDEAVAEALERHLTDLDDTLRRIEQEARPGEGR